MIHRRLAAPNPHVGLFAVGLGASLASMDVAVNVAFPAITSAFSLDARAIRWVVIAYVVTYACLMLAFGRLGDAFGYRRVFRAGLVTGLAAYLGCALAPDFRWLLAARILQGVSTALVLSCTPALATQIYSESRRTQALGRQQAITALAATVAPPIGGLAIAWFSWSGVFWMRVPLVLLALAMLRWVPDRDQASGDPDRYGLALLAAAIACLLLAPSLLGTHVPLPLTSCLLIAGLLCLKGFADRQRRTHLPFFPSAAARNVDFVAHNVFNVALQFTAFAVPLVVPYYLARVAGYGPSGIGAALMFSPIGMLLGAFVAPACVHRFDTRRCALAATLFLTLGTIAIGTWPVAPTIAHLTGALLLNGFGLGMFQVVYTDVIVATLPRSARGVAGSLTMVTRTIGVVTAASALTAALFLLEAAELQSNVSARDAYTAAFSRLFFAIALLPAVVLLVGCVRPTMFRLPPDDISLAP